MNATRIRWSSWKPFTERFQNCACFCDVYTFKHITEYIVQKKKSFESGSSCHHVPKNKSFDIKWGLRIFIQRNMMWLYHLIGHHEMRSFTISKIGLIDKNVKWSIGCGGLWCWLHIWECFRFSSPASKHGERTSWNSWQESLSKLNEHCRIPLLLSSAKS